MAEEKEKQQKGPKSGKPSAEEIAAKKAAKKAAKAAVADEAEEIPSGPAPTPRLLIHYKEKVVPELKQRFGYSNVLAVPRLEKIIISMGLGKFATAGEKEKLNQAEKE